MRRSKRSKAALLLALSWSLPVAANPEESFGPQPKKGAPAAEAAPTEPALPAVPASPNVGAGFQLVEIFSVEKNPGSGRLEYRVGQEPPESFAFGAENGLYGLAMAFRGEQLPPQYGKNFAKDLVIQVALGTLKSRLEGQVPQFGAATLVGTGLPTLKTRYPVVVPQEGRTNALKQMALLLFTHPRTPNEVSDEQKLRTTYFAQSGYMELEMRGRPKIVDVQAQGRPLRFKMHLLSLTAKLQLGTPFNAQPTSLTGTIQFPLYTPHGKSAEDFTRRITGESLEGTIPAPGGDRGLASPKTKTPK